MAVYKSSSLVASDAHELPRHDGSGFVKNGLFRHSKQHMVEKKMFGRRMGRHGKDFQIGKKFKSKKAKDVNMSMKGMSSHSIGPSTEEFDDMLKSSVTHNPRKKKSSISKKFFG